MNTQVKCTIYLLACRWPADGQDGLQLENNEMGPVLENLLKFNHSLVFSSKVQCFVSISCLTEANRFGLDQF